MFHASAASFASATPAPPPMMPPMKPWEYLRLRREAAGLSIDEVARRMSPKLATRSEAARLAELLETRGYRALHNKPILRLASAYPLDPSVYRQLADLPPEQHPAVCRGCGSSYWDTQRGAEHVLVSWTAPHTCTGCVAAQVGAA
ncbi:hypothetical protein GCM10011380_08610 [Sphingomonas metalli]|uniref:Uncharacterized protein n=1 Tax=Sphingomonas metalli TaxID=1779358 RepID=A0A916SXK5_9SPHN|nr:hypothetical protein [Sphingomonas metalli]GGB21329.1 hypothetical protein GCM10011380_08610 [Sphingomonas metalli]